MLAWKGKNESLLDANRCASAPFTTSCMGGKGYIHDATQAVAYKDDGPRLLGCQSPVFVKMLKQGEGVTLGAGDTGSVVDGAIVLVAQHTRARQALWKQVPGPDGAVVGGPSLY